MLTMRQLIDIAMDIPPRDQIDLDVDLRAIGPDRLMRIRRSVDALSDRLDDEIGLLLDGQGDSKSLDEDAPAPAVSPETVRKRAERDRKRQDQLLTLSKRSNAVRASMGT